MSIAVLEPLEERTRRIGRSLFENVDTRGPSIFNRLWWDNRVMDWSMADEHLKVQLFRFIDVLPQLTTTDAINEHLQAYLGDNGHQFPWFVRHGVGLATPGTMTGNLVANTVKQNATRMAKRFIAGTTAEEVLVSVSELWNQGRAFTLDLLGEATVTDPEAQEYLDQYLHFIEQICPQADKWRADPLLESSSFGPVPRVNLSVKLTALDCRFDSIAPRSAWRVAGDRLRQIFRQAKKYGAFINLDMEQYSVKDLTIAIFCRILDEPEFRDWANVGIAIQAYLRDTYEDLHKLRDWAARRGTPVWVRLVKGAYWDYETVHAEQQHWPVPVYSIKSETDANFERCTEFLLGNIQWLRPALGSHNVRSIAHSMAVAEQMEIPPSDLEFQMLFGMGDEFKKTIVDRGHRLRIYTPFGKLLPGMAYLVRRLLENTSNASFLRATFTEHAEIDRLLKAPHHATVLNSDKDNAMTTATKPRETLSEFVNEALLDFTQPALRAQMRSMLEDVKKELGQTYAPLVDGVSLEGRELLDSVNPADPKMVVGRVGMATAEDADRAVAAGVRDAKEWANWSVARRAAVLFDLAQKMRDRRYELSAWEVLECGKQWREADADIAEAIDFCEFYARNMLQMASTRRRNIPGEENAYYYTPRGVTVVISPWNFPLAILCGMTVGPLVAGNPVIMKPAEQSSVIAAKFAELFLDLDLPPGAIQFLPGLGEVVGRRLVEHPDVHVLNFTGSMAVGLEINKQAALVPPGQHHVKRVLAEMGGKNAILVDDDADLDEAVVGIVRSAFGFQGQKCSACSRVIVLPHIYDTLVTRLRDAVASLQIGPPEDPEYHVGPVIDAEAKARLDEAIEKGKSEGNLLFAGSVDPSIAESGGYYVTPHVFEASDPSGFLGQTEFFGPVVSVYKAKDWDEALAWANGTKYALTGGLFSRNPRTIERVKREFEVGNLYINRTCTGAMVDLQPFGGFKLSGIGAKAGGPDYLLQFMVPRAITENTLRRGFAPQEWDEMVD